MNPILAPVDFSESSNTSMHYAAGLAQHASAALKILHVYELPVLYGDAPYLAMQQLSDEIKVTAQNNLDAVVNGLKKRFPSLEITGVLRHGIPVTEILEASAGASLTVMGTRGQTKLERIFIGSTTERVFHHSAIPVLCIPEGTAYKPVKRLAFATDMEDDNLEAAKQVTDFAGNIGASVDFIYINRENSEAHEMREDEMLTKLKRYFNYENVTGAIIDDDDITSGLQHFLAEKNSDILCMFTHERTFPRALLIPSVTSKTLHQLRIPLMVLHQHKR